MTKRQLLVPFRFVAHRVAIFVLGASVPSHESQPPGGSLMANANGTLEMPRVAAFYDPFVGDLGIFDLAQPHPEPPSSKPSVLKVISMTMIIAVCLLAAVLAFHIAVIFYPAAPKGWARREVKDGHPKANA